MAISHTNVTPTGWSRTKRFKIIASADGDTGPYDIAHGFTGFANAAAAEAGLIVTVTPLLPEALTSNWRVGVDATNVSLTKTGGGGGVAGAQILVTVTAPHSLTA